MCDLLFYTVPMTTIKTPTYFKNVILKASIIAHFAIIISKFLNDYPYFLPSTNTAASLPIKLA